MLFMPCAMMGSPHVDSSKLMHWFNVIEMETYLNGPLPKNLSRRVIKYERER